MHLLHSDCEQDSLMHELKPENKILMIHLRPGLGFVLEWGRGASSY